MRTLFGQGEVTKRKRKARGKVKEFCLGRRGKKGNGFGSHADRPTSSCSLLNFRPRVCAAITRCGAFHRKMISLSRKLSITIRIPYSLLSVPSFRLGKKKKKLETRVEVSSLENRLEYLSPIFVSKFLWKTQISKRGRGNAGRCGRRKAKTKKCEQPFDWKEGKSGGSLFLPLRFTSLFGWQVLLSAFWPAKTNPPDPYTGSPLIRVQTYLCPRLDDTPPCCLSLSRHSNRLRSLHLHLKIYGVLRSTNPEANMQCYVRILVCSKDLLQ